MSATHPFGTVPFASSEDWPLYDMGGGISFDMETSLEAAGNNPALTLFGSSTEHKLYTVTLRPRLLSDAVG